MKKLSIILALVLLMSVFSVTAYAQDIPVRADITETADGELNVKVYVENVEKLVSLRVLLEYDTAKYTYKQGAESTYTDENGDETANLYGIWVFGALANGSGCTGAFVSVNGVTKSDETQACEFVIEAVDGDVNARDITITVTELITDDNNEENDIYEKTVISFQNAVCDKETVFNTLSQKGALTLTGLVTENEAVFIPEAIDGNALRRIKTENTFSIPILIFGRNILGVNEDAFSENTTVVAPKGSAPVAVARKNGGKYLEYNESVVIDSESKYILTDAFLVNESNALFSGDADYEITPSYIYAGGYYGTGSTVTVFSGNKLLDMTLCVKGDVNGDSVCDAIDVTLCEKYVNGLKDMSDLEKAASDLNLDGEVTAADYSQIVNISLEGEYKIFKGIRGDVNGDYTVDALDIAAFNRSMAKSDLSEEEKAVCDFDNDGEVTEADREILTELAINFI